MLWLLFFLSLPAQALTTSPHSLRIEDSSKGNVILGADQATLERGELYQTIVLLWGNLDVSGEVDKVILLSGHARFHPGAKLKSSLVVMGGSFDVDSGADVPSEKIEVRVPSAAWRALESAGAAWRDNVGWVSKAAAGVVSCLLLWLIGWALFAAFPSLQVYTEGALAPNWPKNLLLGLIGSIAAFAVLVLLLISIIGWLLLPFYGLLMGFCCLVSYLAAGLWAGHRLLPPKAGKKLNPGGFFLGLLAFQFLWVVPVWWAAIPVLLLWLLAWGTLVRASAKLWK